MFASWDDPQTIAALTAALAAVGGGAGWLVRTLLAHAVETRREYQAQLDRVVAEFRASLGSKEAALTELHKLTLSTMADVSERLASTGERLTEVSDRVATLGHSLGQAINELRAEIRSRH